MENANMGHVSLLPVVDGRWLRADGSGKVERLTARTTNHQPSTINQPSGQPRTLREATQEFESLFIAQMMQAMRSTVPESGLLGSGGGQQIFRQMLDQELSLQVAHAGGFGVGEMLYRQLDGNAVSSSEEQTEEPGR